MSAQNTESGPTPLCSCASSSAIWCTGGSTLGTTRCLTSDVFKSKNEAQCGESDGSRPKATGLRQVTDLRFPLTFGTWYQQSWGIWLATHGRQQGHGIMCGNLCWRQRVEHRLPLRLARLGSFGTRCQSCCSIANNTPLARETHAEGFTMETSGLGPPQAHEFLHRVSSGDPCESLKCLAGRWKTGTLSQQLEESWGKANCSRLRKTTVAVSTTYVHAKRSLWAAQMAWISGAQQTRMGESSSPTDPTDGKCSENASRTRQVKWWHTGKGGRAHQAKLSDTQSFSFPLDSLRSAWKFNAHEGRATDSHAVAGFKSLAPQAARWAEEAHVLLPH